MQLRCYAHGIGGTHPWCASMQVFCHGGRAHCAPLCCASRQLRCRAHGISSTRSYCASMQVCCHAGRAHRRASGAVQWLRGNSEGGAVHRHQVRVTGLVLTGRFRSCVLCNGCVAPLRREYCASPSAAHCVCTRAQVRVCACVRVCVCACVCCIWKHFCLSPELPEVRVRIDKIGGALVSILYALFDWLMLAFVLVALMPQMHLMRKCINVGPYN
eukprot:33391-Pelagomonas_calceolata.AAC.5